jgi:hypothetical protein
VRAQQRRIRLPRLTEATPFGLRKPCAIKLANAHNARVRIRAAYLGYASGPRCLGTAGEAHHILGAAEYPEGEYDPDNGVALCTACQAEITALQNRARIPHTRLGQPSDWSFALGTIEQVARAPGDGAPVSIATEIRAREKVMGTTVDARLGLRLRYVEPRTDAARPAASVTPIDAYRDL